MIRKIGIAIASMVALLLLVALVALRDNVARDAAGNRRIADSDGARIHYFVAGPSQGSLIVLLPSYGRSASDFNELATGLHAAGYRTLAMQPRGVDGSDLPSLQLDLHTFSADLAAVLTAESVSEPVVVVGHAFGNRVARAFGTDFPERTRALVLLAAGGEEPTPPEVSEAIFKALLSVYPESVRRRAIESAFFAEGNAATPHWMVGWYPLAGIAQANAIPNTPYSEWGSGGSAPILVVQPAEDAAAAGGGPRLAQRYPHRVRLVTIPGAGHALLPEQPAAVEAAVVDYLAALPR